MLESLRGILLALLEIGGTRLELAATEIEEERLRVAELLVSACVTLFFLGLGLVMSTGFAVMLFWDSFRLLTVGLFSAAYLGIGLTSAWIWRSKVSRKPRLLAATVAALSRDVEELRRHDGLPRSL